MKADLCDFDPQGLERLLVELGEPPWRARQVMGWVYARGVFDFEAMTDLPKPLRARLGEVLDLQPLPLRRLARSADGTVKYLFELPDGAGVESVLIPQQDRLTLCVSTQLGCPLGCRFCLSGQDGFQRNLTAGEMVRQVLTVQRMVGQRITNVVFMGMGEPLANLEALLRALRILTGPLGLSHRRVTVSTAGLVPQMERLGRCSKVNLAVSLNAADNRTRSWLMPINRRWPLEALLEACRRWPLPPGKRITFEYVMIEGVNDAPRDARRLLKRLRGMRCKVNLIPLNPHPRIPFRPPAPEAVERFRQILLGGGINATVRAPRGVDIQAACGHLRLLDRAPGG